MICPVDSQECQIRGQCTNKCGRFDQIRPNELEPNLWRDLYMDLSKSMSRVRATLGCAPDEDTEDAARRVVAERDALRSRP